MPKGGESAPLYGWQDTAAAWGSKWGVDELRSGRSYDVILQVLLDDLAALDAYQQDPYHCGVVKKHMHAVAENSIAMDYTVE